MSYEEERGGSGWAVAGIVVALGLVLVVLVGGCAVVGVGFLAYGSKRASAPTPRAVIESPGSAPIDEDSGGKQ